MTTLETVLNIKNNWDYKNALDLATTRDKNKRRYDRGLDAGGDDNEATLLWHDERVVTPSTSIDDIDLSNLTDAFGKAIAFSAVKQLLITNIGAGDTPSPSAGEDLLVGGAGAANDAWGAPFDGDQDDTIVVPSGGNFTLTNPLNGFAVVYNSQDILRIANDGTVDITFTIQIVGI